MGLFGQEEQDAPEVRGGFFKRLRAPRAGFVEAGSGAEPKFTRSRSARRDEADDHSDAPSAATRATNPQVMFLGRALSGGEIEDIESNEIEEVTSSARSDFKNTDASMASAGDAPVEGEGERPFQPFVPPICERPTYESLLAATAASTQPAPDAAKDAQPVASAERTTIEAAVLLPVAQSASEDAGAAAVPQTITPPVVESKRDEEPAEPVAATQSRGPDVRFSDSQPTLGDAEDEGDRATDLEAPATGRPQLVSADSLPDYKRILTVADDDAALRIPASARKEFVAVELQPGVAITVATARFAQKAQYATFIKDLGQNDILVREEMIATEAVVAAIYLGKSVSSSNSTVREASRAIGNFRDIVEAAHSYGASDIHFEPREFHNEVEIRFRVNGDMYTYSRMPKAIVRRALFAAYSDLVQRNTNSGNSFQPSAPQSAMIPLVVKTDTVNLRWQSSPLVGGYDVTLRLLDGNFKNYSVLLPKDMGLETSQLALIDTLNYVSGGITALTGETGSGKTTTLRALSYMLPDRELKKQFAVNEPSEYPMPWLSDYSIIRRPDETDDEANRKYAEVIRTLMRQDPDDLTIGEVRDRVVMGLVSELALTGHPVRFSLHAGDIIAAVMRMAGGRLQLPIDELASEGFINAVGNQKLIPTLCDHCKLPAQDVMPAADLEILRTKFGLDTERMACRNYDGCQHCRLEGLFTRNGKAAGGTKRPSLAAELYRPTPEFLDRVAQRDWAGARSVWRGERRTGFDNSDMTGKTLYEHALFKASRGLIDPQFINRSMQSFAQYRVMPGVDGRMI
ncbi:ATPase, T2SS/T4P/T4SS family [Caballeronia sp. LZ043]|uniref:ATPase, T2SS/T4P/T4SS family n=1 Tax=Caballeronia sp. LZ043 TaxID=3038569 RepID=UPI00285D3F7C|nr:ATPase, T2SS/T4P/T4SS family [Caballeronia sp. LZ043]MDR5826008.1 ATPase, T2SS/T4P/T4SS family [Caballeronia sp. LZ043]